MKFLLSLLLLAFFFLSNATNRPVEKMVHLLEGVV